MSLLADFQIKDLVEKKVIKVDPYDSALVNPASLDIRLGVHYTKTKPINYSCFDSNNEKVCALMWQKMGNRTVGCIDPTNKGSFAHETFEADEYWLMPQEMILVSMLERITLPDFITAKLCGKSSLGRLGLGNSEVAGLADAGWDGVLVMELFNHSPNAILLSKGMKVGHLLFFEHEPVEFPYGVKGRYQNQAVDKSGSQGV